MHVEDSSISIIGAAFTSCTAGSMNGGGLYLNEASAHLEGVAFTACSAVGRGGGISVKSGSSTSLSSVEFYNCSEREDQDGGADIYDFDSDGEVTCSAGCGQAGMFMAARNCSSPTDADTNAGA